MPLDCRIMRWFLLPLLFIGIGSSMALAQARNVVVFYEAGQFGGWPANNGLWSWENGNEILVGLTRAKFIERQGHNAQPPYESVLARSRDGGETWSIEQPENFVGRSGSAGPLSKPVDFTAKNFALKVAGSTYHGHEFPHSAFFFSLDRGKSWSGPFEFAGLNDAKELEKAELVPRTDYVVLSERSCLVTMGARKGADTFEDRAFVARTDDGGLTWRFVSWISGFEHPARSVMPSTVRLDENRLLTVIRRKQRDLNGPDPNWIECCESTDLGATWKAISRVDDTGINNGNPPAMIRLKDGRFCVTYGNRKTLHMMARFSTDEGRTWGEPIELRTDYQPDQFGDSDLGYPRLVQRPDGKLVTIYYFATKDRPEPHIEATIFDAPPTGR